MRKRARYRRVDIYPDKHSYKPGDTAHVLIATHAPGAQVLVTTEGQQVYTWSLHPAAGDSLTVDVPIEERFEPNFFLNVAFVKNEQLFEGSKNISVPAVEKVLKVTVETDKPEYRPGEQVTYTVTAQDAQGHPVSAELSLGVVDEAIYAVRPDTRRASREGVLRARMGQSLYAILHHLLVHGLFGPAQDGA